jgi:predicted MPP superfamily phosphohydrolase
LFRPGTSITFLVLCLAAQIIAWRLCLRRSDRRWFRVAVHAVFTIFNLGYVAVIYLIPRGGMQGDLWTWVGRPAISWQTVHILGILPAAGIAWILYLVGKALWRSSRWAVRRARRGAEPGGGTLRTWGAEASAGCPAPHPGGGPEGAGPLPAEASEAPSGSSSGAGASRAATPSPVPAALSRDARDPAFRAGRRDFVRAAGSAGIFAILGTAGYAVFRQSSAPVARRVSLSYPGLPRELHGFTIAHLSDVHLGMWSNPREMELAVERAGMERPDMVVFTGDMVDRTPRLSGAYGPPVARHMAKVPHGVWAVLGNHDHWTDPYAIAAGLEASGIRVLREERADLGPLPLSLTGLDDQGVRTGWIGRRGRVDEDSLDILDFSEVKGPPERPGDFRILLNHRPEGFRQAAVAGFGLYLAGHTHGGQYSVPWNLQENLGKLIWKYTSGLYSSWDSHLNVSCGLASVGTPFRFGPWPEFTVITLNRGPAGGTGPIGA